MKSRFLAVLVIAASVTSPVFAGTDTSGLTRAQVHAELAQLRAVGYDQSRGEDANYPAEIQAAEARLAAQRGDASYGGFAEAGSPSAGVPKTARHLDNDGMQPIYFGQ